MKQSNFGTEETEKNKVHFQSIVLDAPIATAIYYGQEMIIEFANEEMLKLWGKDSSVVGKTLREAIPELEGQPFHGLLENVYKTGVVYKTEEDRADLNVNGKLQTFYFNFTYKPLKDEEGKTFAILNMAVDVTSHVHAKQRLERAEEGMRFALESAGMGTWDLNPKEKIARWDKRCGKLFGFSDLETTSYADLLKYIHPDDAERVNKAVEYALDPASGGNYNIEFRTIGAEDSKVRYIRAKGRAYFDQNGKPLRFAGTALDISEEKSMREEQQKLLTLVDNSADLMSILEPDGRNSYINKAGMELLGFENEEQMLNTPISELHASEDFGLIEKEVLPGIEKNGRWSGKMLVRHLKTGEVFPVYNNSIRIDDPLTGKTVAVGAVMRDLRPEMAAQKALAKSEQLFRNITTASPAALWMTDETGAITYVNQTWLDWTCSSLERQLGTGWTEFVWEEDKQNVLKTFLADLKARRDSEIEFRLHCSNGMKWCIASGKPQFRENGSFWGYIGSCTDVTELKEFEHRLLESTHKLTSILEGLPQIAYTATPEGKIDYFSQKWYDYTGLSEANSLGYKAFDAVIESDQTAVLDVWKADIVAGRPHRSEICLKNKNGAYRWHLSAALPIRNYNGEIISWAGTLTDIHEQKELQQQKDDFLGIASHELKTPVTSIKAYTQVLEAMLRKAGDIQKADMVSKMDGQVNRLTNLIGNLLDVTKIQTGKLQFSHEYFHFNDMVTEIIEELQRTTENHVIVREFADTGCVFSDKYRIGQVITNFITNAIKYSPGSNKIIVYTRKQDDKVRLCVQDFGIGIPRDKKDKVFEQFYRVSGDVQFTFSGLGLGLYIAAEIIRREKGEIWANSVEGKGSTFCFSIPANTAGDILP